MQKFRFFITLGDLNFRIDTSFESAFNMIQYKEYKDLIIYDQFCGYCKIDREMAIIMKEKLILLQHINMPQAK